MSLLLVSKTWDLRSIQCRNLKRAMHNEIKFSQLSPCCWMRGCTQGLCAKSPCKEWELYAVTHLHQTLVFEWYMARLVLQWDWTMLNINTILGARSTQLRLGRAHIITWKKRIFNMTYHYFFITTSIMKTFMICNCQLDETIPIWYNTINIRFGVGSAQNRTTHLKRG